MYTRSPTFNWSRGTNSIRLLPDFDECLFAHHPSKHLRVEDGRLDKLDSRTREEWVNSLHKNRSIGRYRDTKQSEHRHATYYPSSEIEMEKRRLSN